MKFRHIVLAALAAFALSSCATYEYVGTSGDGGYYQGAPDTVYADGYYGDSYYPYYYSGIWGYMDYGWPGYVGYYGFGHPYIVHPYYGHGGGRRYYGSGPSWTPAHGAPGGWRNYGHGAGVLRPQSQPPAYRGAPPRSSGGGHYVPSGGSSRPAMHSGSGGHWSGRGH